MTVAELASDKSKSNDTTTICHEQFVRQCIDNATQCLTAAKSVSVVDYRWLRNGTIAASASVAAMLAIALLLPTWSEVAFRRTLLLDGRLWPRRNHVVFHGVRLSAEQFLDPIPGVTDIRHPDADGVIHVGQGQSISLHVTADAQTKSTDAGQAIQSLPPFVEVIYRSDTGERGRLRMQQFSTNEEQTAYVLNGPPFDDVRGKIELYVRGGDHCIGPISIAAEEQPTIVESNLHCVFPTYMVDLESLRWTPRILEWGAKTSLPAGTEIKASIRSQKSIADIFLFDVDTGESKHVTGDHSDEVSFDCVDAEQSRDYRVYLVDEDSIVSTSPVVLGIESIEDRPPTIRTDLNGIGTAITPNAVLPINGVVEDDYGVEQTWLHLGTSQPESTPIDVALELKQGAKLDSSIDLQSLRDSNSDWKLTEDSGEYLSLAVHATDHYALDESPHIAIGELIRLELVSANELLRILEHRESAERRRLEQIRSELSDARFYLQKVVERRNDLSWDDRVIFSNRFRSQLDKSTSELFGVSNSFENLKQQLINNRINAPERIDRLEHLVVRPLRTIHDSLKSNVRKLAVEIHEEVSARTGVKPAIESDRNRWNSNAESVTSTFDRNLRQLDTIIETLIKLETQNELLDIVRRMIQDQESILKATREERKRDAFEGLLD
ncbi:MAG: hypothetical protein R3C03_03370 [Pirellulaceae bacterium]